MASRLGELQAQVLQLDTWASACLTSPALKEPPGMMPNPRAGRPLIAAPLSAAELAKGNRPPGFPGRLQQGRRTGRARSAPSRAAGQGSPAAHHPAGQGGGDRLRLWPPGGPHRRVRAMHEGIDFNAETGTPVVAAASGVVAAAEYHPEFGNMIDVDHGQSLVSRFTPTSPKPWWHRGSSSTRRTYRRGWQHGAAPTGSHLHFEVRMLGVPRIRPISSNGAASTPKPDIVDFLDLSRRRWPARHGKIPPLPLSGQPLSLPMISGLSKNFRQPQRPAN